MDRSGLERPNWTKWTEVNLMDLDATHMWLNKSVAIINGTLKLLDII